ncbi:MAG: formate--tetrahydrofolate ligase, partial [Clostridiales Family XIII bacterium]|nr:formate--tetrahydrofolate ligase [Clostridiales Family XIII bacterium]
MGFKSDIQIAQEADIRHIQSVADSIGIAEEYVELYGKHKAKIDCGLT